MNFFTKNKKIIFGFLLGVLLTSGVGVFANYLYYAKDISYTKEGNEISIADALNELYDKSNYYINADHSEKYVKSGTLNAVSGSNFITDIGFTPSKVIFIYPGNSAVAFYDNRISTTNEYTCGAGGINTAALNSNTTTSFSRIYSVTYGQVEFRSTSNATWKYLFVK